MAQATMWLCCLGLVVGASSTTRRPNIVFMMLDDMDLTMGSLDYMPHVKQLLRDEGTTFTEHRINEPICCPSRTTVLTGMKAHNTNVTTVPPPYGGIWRYEELVGSKSVALYLKSLGYNTHCLGKMMAGYTLKNVTHRGAGWDGWHVLVDPFTYNFNRTVISDNGLPTFYPLRHQTEVLAAHAKRILKRQHLRERAAKASGKLADPMFLYLTPVVPHDEEQIDMGCKNPGSFPLMPPKICLLDTPPSPLKRHRELFQDVKLPKGPDFNPDPEEKLQVMLQKAPAWVQNLFLLNQTQENWLDFHYQQRLRALQGADEMVADLIKQLRDQDMLDHTYFFFTADNGFHLGHFRLPPTKLTPYENDLRVPLVVRGPSVPRGAESKAFTSNIDFFGAFAQIAQGREGLPSWVDGLPNFLSAESAAQRELTEFEYFGAFISQMPGLYPLPKQYTVQGQIITDYAGVVSGPAGGPLHFKYIFWCDNTAELYNLTADPHEMSNLLKKPLIDPVGRIADRLDALTQVLRACSAEDCRRPFAALARELGGAAPSGFEDSLDPKYDAFFDRALRPHFHECTMGHILENETPQPKPALTALQQPSAAAVPLEQLSADLLEDVSPEGLAELLALSMEVMDDAVYQAADMDLRKVMDLHEEVAETQQAMESPMESDYFFGDLEAAEALLAGGVALPVMKPEELVIL